jgi:hypothetical protein
VESTISNRLRGVYPFVNIYIYIFIYSIQLARFLHRAAQSETLFILVSFEMDAMTTRIDRPISCMILKIIGVKQANGVYC